MSRWRATGRIVLQIVGVLVLALGAAIILTTHAADPSLWPPAQGAEKIRVLLVSNGFHSGIVLPRETLLRVADRKQASAVHAVAVRFAAYDYLEFGWGEEEFYRNTPTISSIDLILALRALFWPFTKAVVHVVGLQDEPKTFFAGADQIAIDVGETGFERLVARLDSTFRREADQNLREAGPGLYGPSLFYPATGHFSIFSDCNRWANDLLGAAGLPSSPLLSLLSPIFLPTLRYGMRRALAA